MLILFLRIESEIADIELEIIKNREKAIRFRDALKLTNYLDKEYDILFNVVFDLENNILPKLQERARKKRRVLDNFLEKFFFIQNEVCAHNLNNNNECKICRKQLKGGE